MDWLTHHEWLALLDQHGHLPGQPHELHLGIDATAFLRDIGIAPHITDYEESYPASLHRWYARVGELYLTIDLSASPADHDACTVTTRLPLDGYPWETLRAIEQLPNSIDLHDVWHIETPDDSTVTHVVIREDPRGFDSPVYRASSKLDANSLLDYLRCDSQVHYAVQKPDPDGNWQVWEHHDDGRLCIGNYPNRSSSVALACNLTRDGSKTIRVSSSNSPDLREYLVADGRVVSVSERKAEQCDEPKSRSHRF
ncbi:hypothetical protein RISK_002770 [Rhodopirellula islandica]|uniref:Uncharacterized protein n=1 Tax=Rhodopirellula islandica TaxID=595434 RepID=A0A0J1EI22_RHOIS|nr:hypothetical protein RISK_002770 [Rhodopirellula islandica]